MKTIIDNLESGQSIESLQRIDNAKYRTYQRLNKTIIELGNNRYLSQAFIASINAVISNDEQDDVITPTQRKKEEPKYKTKLLIILCSLKDGETPESLSMSDNCKYRQYKRTTNNLENISNNGILSNEFIESVHNRRTE